MGPSLNPLISLLTQSPFHGLGETYQLFHYRIQSQCDILKIFYGNESILSHESLLYRLWTSYHLFLKLESFLLRPFLILLLSPDDETHMNIQQNLSFDFNKEGILFRYCWQIFFHIFQNRMIRLLFTQYRFHQVESRL